MNRMLVVVLLLVCGCMKKVDNPDGHVPQSGALLTFSGNEGGNGGDTLFPLDGSAWFLSADPERTIKVCISRAENFGVESDVVQREILGAFYSWRSYQRNHDIKLDAGGEILYPVARPQFVPCEVEHDLKIYLGTTSAEVEAVRPLYHNPLAFVHRSSYNNDTGWGKGFIWIAPPGSVDPSTNFPKWTFDKLGGIIRHELGHIAGCGHVKGTIMRRDILEYIKSYLAYEDNPSPLRAAVSPLAEIDNERLLLLNSLIPMHYSTHIDFQAAPHSAVIIKAKIFPTTAESIDVKVSANASEDRGARLELDYIARKPYKWMRFYIEVSGAPLEASSDAPVFRMARGVFNKEYEGGFSEIYTGHLQVNGQVYPVLIQKNGKAPGRPLSIWYQSWNENILLN